MFYTKVLTPKQLSVILKLDLPEKLKFYLAGGTALALQIGHRTSVDFDFYTPLHFDSKVLYKTLEKIFNRNSKKLGEAKDTLFCSLEDVNLSFFWYKYPLIRKPRRFEKILLASLEDIAAMKVIATTQRPVKRDYIDTFFLLKKFSLKSVLSFAEKKYPNFNSYYAVRSLTYFDDVKDEGKKRPIKVFDPDFSWVRAKEKIFEEVKKYQLAMIRED